MLFDTSPSRTMTATDVAPAHPTAVPAVAAPDAVVRRRFTVDRVAVIAEAAAFAVLLGVDGSPGWRVARVAVVIGLCGLVFLSARRSLTRDLSALALGVVGLCTGVGIGVMHL